MHPVGVNGSAPGLDAPVAARPGNEPRALGGERARGHQYTERDPPPLHCVSISASNPGVRFSVTPAQPVQSLHPASQSIRPSVTPAPTPPPRPGRLGAGWLPRGSPVSRDGGGSARSSCGIGAGAAQGRGGGGGGSADCRSGRRRHGGAPAGEHAAAPVRGGVSAGRRPGVPFPARGAPTWAGGRAPSPRSLPPPCPAGRPPSPAAVIALTLHSCGSPPPLRGAAASLRGHGLGAAWQPPAPALPQLGTMQWARVLVFSD